MKASDSRKVQDLISAQDMIHRAKGIAHGAEGERKIMDKLVKLDFPRKRKNLKTRNFYLLFSCFRHFVLS